MTLKEKLLDIESITKEILSIYPEVTNVWYELIDIPVAEIEEYEKKDPYVDIVTINGKDVLRLNVSCGMPNSTVFAYSVPVKKVKAEYIVEA